MPLPEYPTNYPLPNRSGHRGSLDFGMTRTGVPAAQPNQQKEFNGPVEMITAEFEMDRDTYWPWVVWMDGNAWDWFIMPLVNSREPVNVVSNVTVRLVSDIVWNKQGDNWWYATCNFMALQNEPDDPSAPDPLPVYDVITGNPVSNPPTNDVVAGSPANPSPDFYLASLYP